MAIRVPITDEAVNNPEPKKEGPVLFLPDQEETEAARLEENYWEVIKENPDRAAQIMRLARNYGQHPADIAEDPEGAKLALEAPNRENWRSFRQNFPNTAKWLQDPANMATAKDLFPELQSHETMFSRIKRGFQIGELNVEYTRLGWEQVLETLRTGQLSTRGEERLREIETQLAGLDRPTGWAPAFFVGEQLPNYLFMAEQGLKRGLPMAGAFALGALALGQAGPQALVPEEVVTAPAAALTGLKAGGSIGVAEAAAILEAGGAFREFIQIRDKDGNQIDPRLAAQAALAVGIINAGLEYASARLLLRTIPGGDKILDFMAKKEIKDLVKQQTSKGVLIEGVKRYLQNIVGEAGQEFAQEAVTSGMGKALEGKPFNLETIGEVAGEAVQVISPTIQSSGVFGLPGLGGYTVGGLRRVSQAKIDAEAYRAIGEAVADSKYLERYPEGFRELAKLHTQGGRIENVYVDTEQFTTLCQSLAPEGVDPASVPLQIAQELGMGDQYQEAVDTGKPLKIPYADWISKVVKTPLYKGLERHISFSEDGLTLAQAELEEKSIAERITDEQRRAEELIQRNEELQQGRDFVYKDIKDRLLAAGRPENISKRDWPAYVDRAARVWAARAATEAARRGITVEEWYQGANRPRIVKADFMPSDIGPEIRAKLDEREREFIDILAERNQPIEAIEQEVEAEYNRILQEQINYLEQSGGQGVEQGSLVRDEVTGEVVDRIGRQSRNPLWYREFYAEKGRAPSKRELRELALKQLREGYLDDTAEVPPNLEFVSLENTLQGIRNLRSKIAAERSYNQADIEQFNIERGKEAMQRVIEEHIDVLDAMYRPEIGGVSFYWGTPGRGKNFKDGSGVSHIIAKRNAEGKDGKAIAMKMVEVIAKGTIGEKYGPPNWERVNITHDGYTAVLSLYRDENLQTWLLTGWEDDKEVSDDSGMVHVTPEPTQSGPTLNRPGKGAETSTNIIPKPGELFQADINSPAFKMYYQSASIAPEFYSKLERFIEGQKQETFSADQLRGMLSKAGIKEDELKWTGIMTWLEGKKKVSKQEALEYLRTDGQVRVEVIEKRDEYEKELQDRVNRLLAEAEETGDPEVWDAYSEALEELYDQIEDAKRLGSRTTKYSAYTVPGGKNYLEILLILPEAESRFKGKTANEIALESYGMEWGKLTKEQQQAVAAIVIGQRSKSKYGKFSSSHWDESNVVAHIRTTERTDTEDNRVLFVEELQSDWGQEGKRRGFKTDIEKQFDEAKERIVQKYGKPLYELQSIKNKEGNEELKADLDNLESLYEALKNEKFKNALPPAPFVTSTDKWLNLSLKHIIRYAAENGFDKIAWATGEQNAEHYGLSKQIDKIVWARNEQGKYKIEAYKGNFDTPLFYEINIAPEKLPDYVGKELAERIINDTAGSGEFKGLDLKIGGEGMKAFYDKIVPQTVQKFIRQFDKDAKLETIDIGYGPQQGFTISDKLRNVALYEGFPLFQGDDRRAMVNISPDKSLVTLFNKADASSFLHESAHLFLDDMFRYVRSGQADETYLKDWETLAKWLEIKDDQEALTVEQQEKFARGFERYLLEGKAPSEGLRKVFASLRKWLVRIYRDVTGLGVEISDEVRGVMDRMLATEEEIREREAINGYLMATIDQKDVTPATWERLNELREQAHELAVQRALQPQIEDLKPDREAFLERERERIRKIIELEVAELPIFKIMELVRMNIGPHKDVREFARRYLQHAEGITNEGVARFEALAEAYGYTSGDHLAQELVNAPNFTDAVSERLESHMAQFNELTSLDLKLEAEQTLRNDYQLEGLALEKAIFLELVASSERKEREKQYRRQRNIVRAKFEAEAARKYARELLAEKPYRQAVAATSYFAAETKAAVKLSQAIADKDFEAAARYSAQRMLNHALAMEATAIKREVEKHLNFLHKFTLQRRPKIDEKFLNQIDKILHRFKVIDKLPTKAQADQTTLNEWIKSREAYGDADISPRIANEAFRKDYQRMTVEELRELVNAVKNIAKVGRNESRLLTDEKRAEIKAVAAELARSIRGNNQERYPVDYDTDDKVSFKETLLHHLANHKKTEFIVRALDGYKDQGLAWRYLVLPMLRALDKETKLRREAGERYTEIIRKHYGDDAGHLARRRIHVPQLKHLFPKGLTKEKILMMALNWGSELNQKRLIDGYLSTEELSEEEVKMILDRYQRSPEGQQERLPPGEVLKREKRQRLRKRFQAVLDEHMTANDWEFVQDVLDLVNSYWPMIVTTEKIRKGVAPEKREAKPIETKYGVFPGGYFHIAYDTNISEQAYRHSEQDNMKGLLEATYVVPSTQTGFTKATVEEVLDRPLALNLSVVDRHLSNVIHMVSFINAIRDVDRILNEKEVMQAIQTTRGKYEYRQFREWLLEIGYQYRNPLDATEKLLHQARQGVTVVNMGLKITTAVSQLVGILPVMARIGAWRTAAGMMDFYYKFITGRAGEDIKFVYEHSEMMRNRASNRDRDIYDATKQLVRNNKYDRAIDTYFWLTGLMDQAVTIPTWLQSYNLYIEREMKSGKKLEEINVEMASRFADQVVRDTQGTGDVVNMAHVQRGGEWHKLMTMFYSYFSVFANQLMETGERAFQRREYGQLVSFAIYWWFLPAVLGELLAGRGPDDDDEEQWKYWAVTILKYPFGGFVVLRDVVNALGGQFGGFELSPVGEAFQSGIELWNATVGRAMEGDDVDWGKAGWKAFEFGGYWLKYPAKQIRTTVGNIFDAIVEGEEFYLRDLFFPKPESRR